MPLVLGGERVGVHKSPTSSISHAAYGVWDNYISMQFTRAEAIALWNRVEALHDRVDEDPGHPSVGKARERIEHLESKILSLQAEFLKHDEEADAYWRGMTVRERFKDSVHELFGVEPEVPSILGNWHRQLGSMEGAPKRFRMNPTALSFAPPHVAAAYIKGVR